MVSILRSSLLALVAVASLSLTACNDAKKDAPEATATTATSTVATPGEKCEHGVDKAICTRCNPALAVAFKSKNDWCNEHNRAESQCVLCHPELAEKGIK